VRTKYEQRINNARRPQKHDLPCITSILSGDWLTVHVLLSPCSADIVVSDHTASTVYTPRPSYGAKNVITMAHCASNYQWAEYSRRLSTNNDMYFSGLWITETSSIGEINSYILAGFLQCLWTMTFRMTTRILFYLLRHSAESTVVFSVTVIKPRHKTYQ